MGRNTRKPTAGRFSWKPVTVAEWDDLVELFGPRGACGGCWCMWWRLPRRDFARLKGDGTRRALKRIVARGPAPGIIAYDGDRPVGWCCVGPREDFPLLERSRVLARVDDEPVWSIVCFFVARDHRRKGLTRKLVAAAVSYARTPGRAGRRGLPDRCRRRPAGCVRLHRPPLGLRGERLHRGRAEVEAPADRAPADQSPGISTRRPVRAETATASVNSM